MKFYRLLLVCLALFVCSACDYDAPYVPQEGSRLENVIFERELIGNDIVEAIYTYVNTLQQIEDVNVYKELVNKYLSHLLDNKIKFVVLEYRTVDPFGKETIASGTFAYPIGNKSKGVIEVSPVAHTDMYHCTSNSLMKMVNGSLDDLNSHDFMALMLTVTSVFNFTSLYPDCIGGGLGDAANYIRPWLHPTNYGECFYHFRQAVSEYLWDHEQVKLPKETNLLGYSFGGSTVFSVANYYNYCTNIQVKSIFSGGGLYDIRTAMNVYKKWDSMYYCAIPSVLVSFDRYFHLNLDFSKIFTGGLENSVDSPNAEEGGDGYAYWCNNTHDSFEITERWGGDLHSYMHPDFFLPGFQGEFKKLEGPMEEASIVYNTKLDKNTLIRVYHSTEDNIVPFECAQLLYDKLTEDGFDIKLFKLNTDHLIGAAYCILPAIAELDLMNFNK